MLPNEAAASRSPVGAPMHGKRALAVNRAASRRESRDVRMTRPGFLHVRDGRTVAWAPAGCDDET